LVTDPASQAESHGHDANGNRTSVIPIEQLSSLLPRLGQAPQGVASGTPPAAPAADSPDAATTPSDPR
jgi:hypothetical protein